MKEEAGILKKSEVSTDEELSEVTDELMDCLNNLDVSTLEYVQNVCQALITSKSWKTDL